MRGRAAKRENHEFSTSLRVTYFGFPLACGPDIAWRLVPRVIMPSSELPRCEPSTRRKSAILIPPPRLALVRYTVRKSSGLCLRDTSNARWVGKNTPRQHSKILEGPGKPAHRKGWVPYLTRFPAAPQCHIHVTPCKGYQCTLKTHYLATCGPSQTFFPCFAAAFVLLRIHAGV